MYCRASVNYAILRALFFSKTKKFLIILRKHKAPNVLVVASGHMHLVHTHMYKAACGECGATFFVM